MNLTVPARLALYLALLDGPLADAADVERPHRQLRARLADALGGDDAHRHALLDERPGREVHAVAEPADAERRLAGQRAANLDLLEAQFLDLAGDSPVISSSSRTITSSVFGIDDVRPADPAADAVGQADVDLLAAVDAPSW